MLRTRAGGVGAAADSLQEGRRAAGRHAVHAGGQPHRRQPPAAAHALVQAARHHRPRRQAHAGACSAGARR